jgi:hypothetical protein
LAVELLECAAHRWDASDQMAGPAWVACLAAAQAEAGTSVAADNPAAVEDIDRPVAVEGTDRVRHVAEVAARMRRRAECLAVDFGRAKRYVLARTLESVRLQA